MLSEIIHANRDNTNVLQFKDDSTGDMIASDFDAVTKVEMIFDDDSNTSFNSTDNSTFISFSSDGKVTLKLGESGLANGSYVVYFVVYDPVNTNGIRWDPPVRIRKTG